jgi:ribonuclease G
LANDQVIISAIGGEITAAFVEAGLVTQVIVAGPDDDVRSGDVILGRITKLAPALDAAFVDIGASRPGLLPASECVGASAQRRQRIGELVSEGQAVIVQVRREPEAGKGAKLTARPALAGRWLLFLPEQKTAQVSRKIPAAHHAHWMGLARSLGLESGGWIIREEAARTNASAEDLAGEAARLREKWNGLRAASAGVRPPVVLVRAPDPLTAAVSATVGPELTRVLIDDRETATALKSAIPEIASKIQVLTGGAPVFAAAGIDDQIEEVLAPTVMLQSGGVVHITETAALVAIDVDSGTAGGATPEEMAFRVNIEAALAIARQIRLRDLAGHLVIDFLPLRQGANRDRVLARFRESLAFDPRPVFVAGYTRLGHVELTRERQRPSLPRRRTSPCPTCQGTGRVRSAAAVACEALRRAEAEAAHAPAKPLVVSAAPAVIAALKEGAGAAALAKTEARLGAKLVLREDRRAGPEDVEVTAGTTNGSQTDG